MGKNSDEEPSKSESIIAELLNDVKQSSQPFSISDIVEPRDDHRPKKHKKHKHHKKKSKHSKKSRDRSRSPLSAKSRRRSSSIGTDYENEVPSRSRRENLSKEKEKVSGSYHERKREKKRSQSPRKSRKHARRSRSSQRSSSSDYSRKRSSSRRKSRERRQSRERIDKEKLLEIAKKNRQMAIVSAEERKNASKNEFIDYFKRIQLKQERQKMKERGEPVSDIDDEDDKIAYKHPYALPKPDPIKINIVTATSFNLAQKAITCGNELEPASLHQLFPVSSGTVHKENSEWTPIVKEPNVPKSCTDEQKKHVALTSVEMEKFKAQGVSVAPKPPPSFLTTLLPPPPEPPTFMSEPSSSQSPPPLPPVLYVPPKEEMIIKDPEEAKKIAPTELADTLKLRADAQRRLSLNPNDFDAHMILRETNERIEAWAALKQIPGEFTGSTGLKLLTPEQLQPHDPRYHAWVRRDQLKVATPAVSSLGLKLMQKMGWKMGEGLGRQNDGTLEPLMLDVKHDRRGLMAEQEMSKKMRNKLRPESEKNLEKNPISLLMEHCAKMKWNPPQWSCAETGQDNEKQFLTTVLVNGVEYAPLSSSRQKKEAKAVAAKVALIYLRILPPDPNVVPNV